MAMKYYLTEFAQGPFDDSTVRCEVQFRDSVDADVQGTYPTQPLDGDKLGPAWTNADLCAALSKQTGRTITLPPKPVTE